MRIPEKHQKYRYANIIHFFMAPKTFDKLEISKVANGPAGQLQRNLSQCPALDSAQVALSAQFFFY